MIAYLTHIWNVLLSLHRESLKMSRGLGRSDKWPGVEHKFRRAFPTCAACGGTLRLQIHHVEPFHLHPEIELDPANLISLCMGNSSECHLRIGHSGDFREFNPNVRSDAATVLADPTQMETVVAKALAARQKLDAPPVNPADPGTDGHGEVS